MLLRLGVVICMALWLTACNDGETASTEPPATGADMAVTSSAFADGETIPQEFTCEGDGGSPPLAWDAVEAADEYALTMTDPDAPGGTFVHWVSWAIPSSATELGAGETGSASQGDNSAGSTGYTPPCPPEGDDAHRYVFTVYALSGSPTESLDEGATFDELVESIECCIEASGELTGTFGR